MVNTLGWFREKLKQSVSLKDTVHFHYITGGQNSDVYAASEKVWEEQRQRMNNFIFVEALEKFLIINFIGLCHARSCFSICL